MSQNEAILNKLVVGLADADAAEDIYGITRHATGATNALTVGSTTLTLGVAGGTARVSASTWVTAGTTALMNSTQVRIGLAAGTIGFFGSAGAVRASSTGVTDVAGLITVLRNYGLFS